MLPFTNMSSYPEQEAGALTPFLVAAGFDAIIETQFIRVVERMLSDSFGDEWKSYRARTRRWI